MKDAMKIEAQAVFDLKAKMIPLVLFYEFFFPLVYIHEPYYP